MSPSVPDWGLPPFATISPKRGGGTERVNALGRETAGAVRDVLTP